MGLGLVKSVNTYRVGSHDVIAAIYCNIVPAGFVGMSC